MSTLALLQASLDTAVPLWVLRHKHRSFEELQLIARQASQVIAEHGDDILFRSARPGGSAYAFNALAEAIAILSFMPGGVTVFGRHWESQRVDK